MVSLFHTHTIHNPAVLIDCTLIIFVLASSLFTEKVDGQKGEL